MSKENRTVVLKHARKNWMGWDRFEGSPYYLIADIDPNSGQFKTGLSETDQADLEKRMSLTKDTLGPFSSYWRDWTYVIRGSSNAVLNLDNPLDYITYCICKNSQFVAGSKEELSKKPKADFYMVNTIEEIERNIKIGQLRGECFKKISDLAPGDHKKMLRILGERVASMPLEQCTALLYGKVEAINSKETDNVGERLKNLYDILNMDKTKFNSLSTILSAIDNNIISKFKGEYMLEEVPLGTTILEVYKYLQTSEGTKIRASIEQRLNSKIVKEEEVIK